jgi:energy-converting hydrogenase Eha subunit C
MAPVVSGMQPVWRVRFVSATTTLLAAVASFLTVYALCRVTGAELQPAIVAAILALVLARRPSPARAGHLAASFATLPLVAVLAGGIGWLLHAAPIAGAIVFTAGLAVSVWLRNYGGMIRKAGTLIALPLVALLVTPPPTATTRSGRITDLILVACGGAIALAYVTLVQLLARRVGLGPRAPIAVDDAPPPARTLPGLSAASRMALQLGVALAAAFVVGFVVFPGHWGWTVLTAFIVCSGARGRGDAVYKGVLRLIGALAGTVAAAALAHVWLPTGPLEAIVIFALLFAGLVLRDVNYAYWAGALGERLESILAGAICAVAAAWFVMPIRTESVIRRRLADALLALDALVGHEHPTPDDYFERRHQYEHRMRELHDVAPPVVWHRRLFVRDDAPHHPARWIELSRDVDRHARAFGPETRTHERKRAALRRAIGLSRRAIGEHGKADRAPDALTVSDALTGLREALRPAD